MLKIQMNHMHASKDLIHDMRNVLSVSTCYGELLKTFDDPQLFTIGQKLIEAASRGEQIIAKSLMEECLNNSRKGEK